MQYPPNLSYAPAPSFPQFPIEDSHYWPLAQPQFPASDSFTGCDPTYGAWDALSYPDPGLTATPGQLMLNPWTDFQYPAEPQTAQPQLWGHAAEHHLLQAQYLDELAIGERRS